MCQFIYFLLSSYLVVCFKEPGFLCVIHAFAPGMPCTTAGAAGNAAAIRPVDDPLEDLEGYLLHGGQASATHPSPPPPE